MRASLLVIADRPIVELISRAASPEAWSVHQGEFGSNCIKAVQLLRPTVVIVDAREGGSHMADLCRTIRLERGSILLLVALVLPDQPEYLGLLEAGVDECWAEAIDSAGLRVRLSTIHRRLSQSERSTVVRCGTVELNLERYTVQSSGPAVRLTVKQLNVLKHLMEKQGMVVPRRELLERYWGPGTLDDGSIRTCVRRLRQLLAATGAVDVIRTAAGGYVFETSAAPVKVSWRDHEGIRRAHG